jgi:hypothetical protein
LTTSLSFLRRRSEAEETPAASPESELDGSGDGLRWWSRDSDEEGDDGKGKKSSTSGREEAAAARRWRSERLAGGDGERRRWWWWLLSCIREAPVPLRRSGGCLSGEGDGDRDGDRGMAAAVRFLASFLSLASLSSSPYFFLSTASAFVCLIPSLASLHVHLSLPIPISSLS